MNKTELLGAAIAITLMPCIIGVWMATIVADNLRVKG